MTSFRIPSLALALALGLGLPALAQETTGGTATDGTTAPATEVTGDAATATDLTMGTEVNGPPQVGDTYVAARFEDWEQRCIKTESSADPCQLYQLLKDEQGNSVAEFSIFSLPEGSQGPAVAGATFIAPMETLLTTGLSLQVDQNKARGYPFTMCAEKVGCVARLGFTAEEVAMFKKGAAATAVIVPFVAPDQKVALKVSLKGFTAGFDAMKEANRVADEAAAKAAAEAAPSGN